MNDSLLHRSRLFLQPYLPDSLIGLGALARLAQKTHVFKGPKELTQRWGARLKDLNGGPLSLDDFEFSVLSQNGEDGLLEAIFQVIGFKTRSVLEFGFAATEASLLTLALSHNLSAYFLDGSDNTCKMAAALFRLMRRPGFHVAKAFMTAENINDVIRDMGLIGEIDAVSIDVEGNDYWLWKALTVVNPRLVVAEYIQQLGPVASVAIPYDPSFHRSMDPNDFYRGASLAAMTKLAKEKGYRLIGSDRSGVSAFFLREDIAAPAFPTISVEEAFRSPSNVPSPNPVDHNGQVAGYPFIQI